MVARVVRAVGAAECPDSRDTQGLGAGLPARIVNTIRLGVGAARDLVLLHVGGAARRRFYPNAYFCGVSTMTRGRTIYFKKEGRRSRSTFTRRKDFTGNN